MSVSFVTTSFNLKKNLNYFVVANAQFKLIVWCHNWALSEHKRWNTKATKQNRHHYHQINHRGLKFKVNNRAACHVFTEDKRWEKRGWETLFLCFALYSATWKTYMKPLMLYLQLKSSICLLSPLPSSSVSCQLAEKSLLGRGCHPAHPL